MGRIHCYCTLLLSVMIGISLKTFYYTDSKFQKQLVIGILSARNNFKHRDIIRNTWLNDSKTINKAHVSFIVGHEACSISPEYRRDEYSCHSWNLTNSAIVEVASHKLVPSVSSICSTLYNGFSFQVHRMAIRIKSLGILIKAVFSFTEPIFIVLKEETTQEVFVKIALNISSDTKSVNGFHFIPIEEYVLPPYFKGSIEVNVIIKEPFCENVEWNPGGELISFSTVHTGNSFVPFTVKEKSAASMSFIVHDTGALEKHLNAENLRHSLWQEELKKEKERLNEEINEYNDIVLVDIIDVYRNLPLKILHYLSKLMQEIDFEYFMKTDDDCFINLRAILAELKTLNKSKLWWGRFRRDWLVNRAGKWEDKDYPSQTYPFFACGSGNIMSKKLVNWLSSNIQFLHAYQGEDVSLGIWLSSVKPDYLDDVNWSCDSSCRNTTLVRAQLSSVEMLSAYKLLKECGSICYCPVY